MYHVTLDDREGVSHEVLTNCSSIAHGRLPLRRIVDAAHFLEIRSFHDSEPIKKLNAVSLAR